MPLLCVDRNELHNARRVTELLKNDKQAAVPEMHSDLCTRHLLIMEWIDGCKVRVTCFVACLHAKCCCARLHATRSKPFRLHTRHLGLKATGSDTVSVAVLVGFTNAEGWQSDKRDRLVESTPTACVHPWTLAYTLVPCALPVHGTLLYLYVYMRVCACLVPTDYRQGRHSSPTNQPPLSRHADGTPVRRTNPPIRLHAR